MLGLNPFFNRKTITDTTYFFGRENELRTIFSRISTSQSCDVYGPRKIGKSSLLYYIYKKAQDTLGNNFKIVYIDLQDARYHTINDFLIFSLNELGCESKGIKTSNNLQKNLIFFSESIKKLSLQKKPVLLIDEFEKILEKPEFNVDVFDNLRSLANGGCIAYVTASSHSIKKLCTEGKFSSPFYNIFLELPLGNFSPEETTEFLSTKIYGIEFDEKEIQFIYTIVDNHPLNLQIACYNVFENRGNKWDETKLKNTIFKEIKSFEPISSRDNEVKISKIDENENSKASPNKLKEFIESTYGPATVAALIIPLSLELYEMIYNKSTNDYTKHATIFFIGILIFILVYLFTKRKANQDNLN